MKKMVLANMLTIMEMFMKANFQMEKKLVQVKLFEIMVLFTKVYFQITNIIVEAEKLIKMVVVMWANIRNMKDMDQELKWILKVTIY